MRPRTVFHRFHCTNKHIIRSAVTCVELNVCYQVSSPPHRGYSRQVELAIEITKLCKKRIRLWNSKIKRLREKLDTCALSGVSIGPIIVTQDTRVSSTASVQCTLLDISVIWKRMATSCVEACRRTCAMRYTG